MSNDEELEIEGESVTAADTDEGLGAPSLQAALEALIMVAEEPMSTSMLAQFTRTPEDQVVEALHDLSQQYIEQGRGFDLRERGGGWRFWTRDNCSQVVERFVLEGQTGKLSQAALETLAVIAYRQPISRARISAIRGVNVEAVMKTLVTRGLVEECGIEHETGAILYRTTNYFLERIGVNNVEDLPALAPFLPDIEGLDEVIASLTE